MSLDNIRNVILDESSSLAQLSSALNQFVLLCSEITGVKPNRSFDAWAEDSLLADGVAINPEAAAHCAFDCQRSVVFMRGFYAAIATLQTRSTNRPITILYAGCGPFATLLLPLLGAFSPGELNLTLLDIHKRSLSSVDALLRHFSFSSHTIQLVQDDACNYQHTEALDIVIAETMQKSLEQEPQFAVSANLAPQLFSEGIFIPQCIEVQLCLYDSVTPRRQIPLASVCTLNPKADFRRPQKSSGDAYAKPSHAPVIAEIPKMSNINLFQAALFTRIQVFEQYVLNDNESELTLPRKCHELLSLQSGEQYEISYQLGSYPTFHFEQLDEEKQYASNEP